MVGGEDTDYGDNNTSSEKPGFYSNTLARVTWNQGSRAAAPTSGYMDYEHPVVQVRNETMRITLKKVDGTDSAVMITLSGAEFDLYRKCDASMTGSTTIKDADGQTQTCIRINDDPIKPLATTGVVIGNLPAGDYYLVETAEPDGYVRLAEPVSFKLDGAGIRTTDTNAVVSGTDKLTISIKNKSGYELPETGGIGSEAYILSGILCMSAAVLLYGFSVRRKRERRHR